MKLTKTIQAAILFTLYLSRSGRARTKDISANLNIPRPFLEQIARKLRLAGVVKSTRGIGGGHELNPTATLGDVLKVFGDDRPLTQLEQDRYSLGTPEQRALASFSKSFTQAANVALNRRIANVMGDLVANEVAKLNKVNETGVSH